MEHHFHTINKVQVFNISIIFIPYVSRVVEWLDEYHPGSFRQAQVSFSTRIPTAFPLGDSLSMSTTVSLYSTAYCMKNLIKQAMKDIYGLSIVKEEDENELSQTVKLNIFVFVYIYKT